MKKEQLKVAVRKKAKKMVTPPSKIIGEDIERLTCSLKDFTKYFEGKTFLITGAGGFLGRYMSLLLKYLNDHVLHEKASALLLDNFVIGNDQSMVADRYLKFFRHDVIRPFKTGEKIDYILHAAGIASPVSYTQRPIETMEVGTLGTRNMLELARAKRVKSFVFFSSSEVYGDPDEAHVPTPETYNGNVSILGPRSCYDESKRFGETMCFSYWHAFQVPVKMVRPFNVYGPGIRSGDGRVLPNFIEHALKDKSIPVHGDGRNTRTFCYINDALEGIFKVLFSNANGEAFNIGNPRPEISVDQLAEMVARAMPHPVTVEHLESPLAVYAKSNPKRRCPDISKLQRLTDFRPKYELTAGVKRTIDWFRGI